MLPKSKKLTTHAQALRREMTREEKHLWYDFLKNHPCQFNRQKVIGSYIADFYCHSAALVVEIDGSQHYEEGAQEYDERRTAYFSTLGIRVLRFTNLDVKQRFEGVCTAIDQAVIDPHPSGLRPATFPQGKALERSKTMSDCLFCKIIAGEIPSNKVFEDETVFAFYDIDPQAPTHFLVIPKTHIPSCGEVTPDNAGVVAHCFEVISQVTKELGISEFRVVSNCGQSAGQSVPHLHFHVLAGRDMTWPPG